MTIQLDVQAISKTFYRMQDSPLQVLSDISSKSKRAKYWALLGPMQISLPCLTV